MTGTRTAAIRQTISDRPDLLIFEVMDQIHTSDIERMAKAVETGIERFDEIDILLVFRAFEGATLGALVDGEGIAVSLRSNAHVRRYGVVGAPGFAKILINLFDHLTPVDARTFDVDQINQAHAWINNANIDADRNSEGVDSQ